MKAGKRLIDSRHVRVECAPAQAFAPIRRIGGETGWYYADRLWWVRCFIDRLLGGPCRGRERPQRDVLYPGDKIDCWRVGAYEPDRLLILLAEMKLPGRAWLQFQVEGNHSGSTIRQTAAFDPDGIAGLLYWYGLYPIHKLIFAGMLRGIARAATLAPPGQTLE